MSKLLKVIFAASVFVAAAASAQTGENYKTTEFTAKKPNSAYVQDSRGTITRNSTGLCWHTGYWTPADAVPGCDGPLSKPVAQARQAVAAPVAVPSAEKVTYAADTFFAFDKYALKPAGKETLDQLIAKMQGMDVEVIVAVGHTDSIGTVAYNQKLSERRADAVKAYLVSKGVPQDKIYTEGRGKKEPVASNKTAEGRAKNRRVDVEIVGTRK